jgi:hypothetical protein
MPFPVLDELDPAAVSAAYERRVAAIAPDQVPDAMRILDGLDPKRWRLEWHLPLWLGNAFGLDRSLSTEIAVSNVLGLASLRLRDGLIDGDVEAGDVAGAPALIATLYEASIDPYRSRFTPASRFWKRLDRWMTQWKAATEDNGQPGAADGFLGDADDPAASLADQPLASRAVPDWSLGHLSRRGAPLKISAYAVCLLTKRAGVFPAIERCLDDALAAMVLYDHVCDWQDDLASGRWNAFVAATGTSQRAEDRERARAGVLAALLAGDAIERSFARIRAELERAVAASDRTGIPALSAHLGDLATQLDAEGSVMRARYGELGDRAAAAIFGDHPLARRGMLRDTTP